MNSWIDSTAFGMGLLSGGVGIVFLVLAWLAGRRGSGGDGRESAQGRAAALADLRSPATGRPCVCYHERAEAAPEPGSREGFVQRTEGRFVDRVCGVFAVQGDAGAVLVWPGLGTVRFLEGWTEVPRDGGASSLERIIAPGAPVTVRGRPGRYEEMMAAMAGVAADQPFEVLRALQTRADLRALPCYWPRGGSLDVREGGGPDDEPAGPGLFAAAGAACLALAALLLGGAYARLF